MVDIFIAPKRNKVKKQPTQEPKNQERGKKLTAKINRSSSHPHVHGEKVKFLSSFKIKPQGISFRDQAEDEEIFLFLRRHFITNVPWLITTFILVTLPLFGLIIYDSSLFPFKVPLGYTLILVLFYYLIVASFAFLSFLNWFYNTSLVTDKRVVDIDFSDIIYHDIAITKLDLIEDVDYVQTGFIRSFFNYGDVFIQTAGEKLNFDFLAVPHPEKVIDVVQNLMGGDRNAI